MFQHNIILQILFICYALSFVKSDSVETTTGEVSGKVNHYGNLEYRSYEGIPYAEPPIGDLRFKPPVPIKPWDNVLNAITPGPVCPQTEYFYSRSEMDENCLFLNIYVPSAALLRFLPVVFFIQGGYYIVDSGRPKPIYGPQMLLEKELIVVTMNYRLGALGFLSFDDVDASGNAGLKDILLASKWVKSNIAKFGGNSEEICLYGLGTGAALGHYLLLTEQSTGIFNNAFIASGSALSYRALQINPKENALKLARQLGIKYKDSRCLNKLKEIDAFKIVDAEDYIIMNDPRRAFIFINFFAPAIEKPSPIALITRNPLDIIRRDGLIQKIPVITGFNNQEGLEIFVAIRDNPEIVDRLNDNFELCIPPNINYPPKSRARRELANSIRNFYFGGRNISIFNAQNYINLITDTAYSYSIDYWIKLYKNQKINSAVYYYIFEVDGQLNWGKQLEGITFPGACRGDEVGYIFVTNITENKLQYLIDNSELSLQRTLTLFSNFASIGTPVPPELEELEWVETGNKRRHVLFGDKITNVYEPPLPERLGFWYREYGRYYEYERNKKAYV